MLTSNVLVSTKGDGKDVGGRVRSSPSRPNLPKKLEVRGGELSHDLPKEGEQTTEDDDDWTIVENEDGVQEVTRRPPPSYDDATRT